jgi:aspartyl-tRNA(Asn)/glutamyl-tRNA(Gln) amidotransferase subunit A
MLVAKDVRWVTVSPGVGAGCVDHEGVVVGLRQPGDANRANRANVPVGAQLMGLADTESLLAAIVDTYQQVTDWHTRKPTP